jgi:manganese-dependent ADP-ribose/CDP-alcohol diphosphatase
MADAASRHSMAEPEPILDILDNSDCVSAWFAGHDHEGGYAFRNGVHHITIKGMVEAPLENAYAIVELLPDKIRITGIGKEVSRELPIKR